MAGVDVGGDESVTWHAEGDNVRKDKTLKHEMKGNSGWLQNGVDEAEGDFTIKIKIPSARDSFLGDLADAVNQARKDATIPQLSFALPIEFGQHQQIQIGWNSDLGKPHPNKKIYPSAAKTAPDVKRPAASKGSARTVTAKASKGSKQTPAKAKKKTGRRR